MALVAATAVGLALHRAFWSEEPPFILAGDWRNRILAGMVLTTPLAATWTVASLFVQLWPKQKRWRRRLARPGAAVCCAASSALGVGIALLACGMRGGDPYFLISSIMLYGLPAIAGTAVASAWILVILIHGYRPATDWADRLGRVMGHYWMIWLPVLGWCFVRS